MKWRIWDKKTSISGIPNNIIDKFDQSFVNSDVIIVSDNGKDIYFDSVDNLKREFDTTTDDVNELADRLIKEIANGSIYPYEQPDIQNQEYIETDKKEMLQCRHTKVEHDGVSDEKINLILDGINISGDYTKLKILDDYNKQREKLLCESDKAFLGDGDYTLYAKLIEQADEITYNLTKSNTTLTLNVIDVYEFKSIIIVKCENSMNLFIDKELVDDVHYSEIEYDRKKNNGQDIQHVHYVNIHVKLEHEMTVLNEKGNSVFVNIF